MSTQDSRGLSRPVARNTRRKKALIVDLNVPPPVESMDNVGPSFATVSQNVQVDQPGDSIHPAPIDLDALDDVVVMSSPSAFHVAKNNSRGVRARPLVVDLDSEDRSTRSIPNNLSKRRRAPTIIDCDAYVERETERRVERAAPPPPPPPEPTFSCPICMGPLVEEMSTKCGHIFCKNCIKASIAAQNKCPTCRRKVTIKDIIRIYLPTTK